MENDTQRQWRYDLRRDLRDSALVMETDGTTAIARVRQQGAFMLAPGNNLVTPALAVEDGVSDMADTTFDLTIRYIPRFRFLSSI